MASPVRAAICSVASTMCAPPGRSRAPRRRTRARRSPAPRAPRGGREQEEPLNRRTQQRREGGLASQGASCPRIPAVLQPLRRGESSPAGSERSGTALALVRCVRALHSLVIAIALNGCASLRGAEEKALAADPAPDAGFVAEPEKLEPQSDRMPFDRMWLSPERDWSQYPKLYVAVVDVHHVLEMSWWEKLNIRKSKVEYDLVVVADELRQDLIEAFRDDPQHHFQIVLDPADVDADTAQLEVALVELVPNKALLGALGLAAWGAPLEIGVPVATATAFIAHGAVAMEARVRDGKTGEVWRPCGPRDGKMRGSTCARSPGTETRSRTSELGEGRRARQRRPPGAGAALRLLHPHAVVTRTMPRCKNSSSPCSWAQRSPPRAARAPRRWRPRSSRRRPRPTPGS